MIILCLDENINVLSCNMYIFWHSVSQSASKHLCIWSNSYFHLWQDKPRSGLYEPFYSQRWSKNLRAARQPDTSIFLTYSYWEDYWVSDPSACTTSLVFLTWTQIYLNFSSVSAVLFRPKGAGGKKKDNYKSISLLRNDHLCAKQPQFLGTWRLRSTQEMTNQVGLLFNQITPMLAKKFI